MRSWRFKLQLSLLLVSLAFILAILGAYAYLGLSYAQGQGLPWDRRQLAGIAAQLERAYPRQLHAWIAGRGSPAAGEDGVLPTRAQPPPDILMPPASMAGFFRAADGELVNVWRARPPEGAGPEPPPGSGPPPGGGQPPGDGPPPPEPPGPDQRAVPGSAGVPPASGRRQDRDQPDQRDAAGSAGVPPASAVAPTFRSAPVAPTFRSASPGFRPENPGVAPTFRSASPGESPALRTPGERASGIVAPASGPSQDRPEPGQGERRSLRLGQFRFRIPPREREALVRLCEQAVREQNRAYEFLARPDSAILLYAHPLRDGGAIVGATWSLRFLRETPVGALSVWALPVTIVAALVGMSAALWTAVSLQRNLMAVQAGLELGREMVANLIPADAPEVKGYVIARRAQPATEVGGDFYNLFPVSGGRIGVVLGDIAGTGVAAALGMAVVTTLVEEYARSGLSPATVMARASERLEMRLRSRKTFATAVYGRLDLADHTLCLCSAGQTPCIWLRGDQAQYVKIPGTPLGRIGATGYQEETLRLEIGDTLVFATDGFVEMQNGRGRQLGYDGWLRLVDRHRHCSPGEMVDCLFAAAVASDPSHRDDLTLLILRRNG